MKTKIRVMLVEDSPRYREVISLALKQDTGIHLACQFGTAEIALRSLQEKAAGDLPDLILLDLRLPGMDGLEALPQFLAAAPAAKIMILTQSDDEADVLRAISLGASGYLLKSSTLTMIIDGIRTVMSGGASLDAGVARFLINTLKTRLPKDSTEGLLTDRQMEILNLLGDSRHERPHKPVLLLAVFDALASGKARPDRVPWSQWLRDRFGVYFDLVKSHNDECSPENPFLYLRSDGFWQPVTTTPQGEVPLSTTPVARDLGTDRVFARFIDGWDVLVAGPQHRMAFREAIVARYFPLARSSVVARFVEPSAIVTNTGPAIADEAEEILPGRSSAFRRRVLEIYDFQCVACGLRIWMPEHELSFVDAAHLVPFSETRNDHPTNGLALCKNHHWALDQRLIAPDTGALWRVSRYIEPRRSRGEEELARLASQPVLPPAERAFAPDRAGLEWRFARLLK